MLDAEVVIQFIVDHPELTKPGEEEEEGDRNLLRFLQSGEEVKLNTSSYTIYLGTAWGSLEELVTATEKHLENSRTGDSASLAVSTQSLIVDDLDFGSVTVTFWNKPKSDGRSKLLIQGKGYETFFLWTLPSIIKEAASIMTTDPLPAIELVKSKPPQKEQAIEKTSLEALCQGFHKVELCLVDLVARTGALEGAVAKVTSSLQDKQVKDELAKVSSRSGQQVREELLSKESTLQQSKVEEILTIAKKTQEAIQSGQNLSMHGGANDASIKMLSQINNSMKTLVNAVVNGDASLKVAKPMAPEIRKEPQH